MTSSTQVRGHTKWHQQAEQAGRRHIVEALEGVHVEALGIDEDLDQRQPCCLPNIDSVTSVHCNERQ